MGQHIFRWRAVKHGWASYELVGEDGVPYRATVGDSGDVFKDLLVAVRKILLEHTHQTFSFDNEPGEVRWTLEPDGSSVKVRVALHSTWGKGPGEERWSGTCISRALAMDVLSSTVALFEELGSDGFRESWPSYPYPEVEVEAVKAELTDL